MADGGRLNAAAEVDVRVGRRAVGGPDGRKFGCFEVGAVKPLFQTRVPDVTADGQRFLINTAPEEAASAPITVVLKWTAGLKKK